MGSLGIENFVGLVQNFLYMTILHSLGASSFNHQNCWFILFVVIIISMRGVMRKVEVGSGEKNQIFKSKLQV